MHDDSIVLATHGLLHQDISQSESNIYGGHDYYNSEHQLVMQSHPTVDGGYSFISPDGQVVMHAADLSGQEHLTVHGTPLTMDRNVYGGHTFADPQTHTFSYTEPNIFHGQTLFEHEGPSISDEPNIFGGHSYF
ncbi:hypothetical protein [Acidithiobacillus ferriphilus]|uniref:Uncharacterized protein n=1 Tax=Acidithiobacillus ferrooxidans TaxID=920 RepID=A0A179BLA5_ACIFR|nr:hypothetical protein [Acidithiobacillus ferriphilus]MBU2852971.1 hypothetical protein [Acidithiobacillus ferriphilus]MEB8603795.1 hypothetical protein [Acidithiobacillus ferriphilus]OAP91901.1 hypothetical protein A4H96_05500 [Acidithiobacillus ferrooxidans]